MTTADKTGFCLAKIEHNGQFLWIDGNQKITAGNGDFNNPKPNAFSIIHINDCPFSTEICRKSCYVHNLEKYANEVYQKYIHNSKTVREILSDEEWPKVMGWWISENAKGGFRWHVSGDVFSEEYANFIVAVCKNSSNVKHWIYTRSYPYVKILVQAKNLVVNLSADKDNLSFMLDQVRYGARVCYMSDNGNVPNLPEGSVIFPDYQFRLNGRLEDNAFWNSLTPQQKKMVCPVDMFGKSQNVRCGVCKKCLR